MNLVILLIVVAIVVIAIVWGKSRKNRSVEEPVIEPVVEEKPLIDYYSRFVAESCITKDYTRPIADKALSKVPMHEELWNGLQKVNKHSPVFRDSNDMDKWFAEHAGEFHKFGDVLAYIEHYPSLMDTYIANIKDPDDLNLQKRLISMYGSATKGFTKINYVNLLCRFCSKWDLRPEIKAIVFLDPRFSTAKKIYELYHK